MAAELVNLRQFKKRKARQNKEKAAEQNRTTFGRTKAEKTLSRKIKEQQDKALDQGRLEKPGCDPVERRPK